MSRPTPSSSPFTPRWPSAGGSTCRSAELRYGETIMRALQLDGGLGLANLKVVELPKPEPGPHEVLIRVRACSLNYRDLLMIEGVYGPQTPLPMTPFSDGSGVVEAVGEGVTRFKV